MTVLISRGGTMRSIRLLALCSFIAACSSSNPSVQCGTGTTLNGKECIGIDGGATCGAGTHLVGGMCVANGPGGAAAPTISSITPTHAGLSGIAVGGGGVPFQLVGTGFADPAAG